MRIDLDELDPSARFGDPFQFLDDFDPPFGGKSRDKETLVDEIKMVVGEGEGFKDVVLQKATIAGDDGRRKNGREINSCHCRIRKLIRDFLFKRSVWVLFG